MKIANLFNRIQPVEKQQYTSKQLLTHVQELCKIDSNVIDPNAKEFSSSILASVVYLETRKINEPMDFLLVLDSVLKNAINSLPKDFSQDALMDIKHVLAKNIICSLDREDREHTAEILGSEKLQEVAAKLVAVMDQFTGTGDIRGFKSLEMYSMLDFIHKYLHGDHFGNLDPVPPSMRDWDALDKVLNEQT